MSLQGATQLKARLKAVRKGAFKPAGKDWADETVRVTRGMVGAMTMPYSKGVLLASIRRKSATQKRAVVVGWYHAYFVDAGPKAHYLTPRSSTLKRHAAQGTIFARQARKMHPGYAARPFRARAAREALRRKPFLPRVIALWNEAA